MLASRLAALLATTCLLSACATAPRGKTIGGGAIAVAGFVAMAHHADGECTGSSDVGTDLCNELIAEPVNGLSDVITMVFGVGLVVLGGGLFIDGLHDFQEESDEEIEERSHIVTTPPPVPSPAASSYAADVPASAVILERVENRLAVQASLIARTGNCASAIATGNELAKRDPDLFAKLIAADTDLAACYDEAAAATENPSSP